MNSALRLILLLALGLPAQPSCQPAEPLSIGEDAGATISLKEFDRLMAELSESEGYFDSDNFISNEAGYLKILPLLKKQGIQDGVYIGVGPDQNYSYLAEIQPRLAIIVDIRRQNLLQHLYFKALFQLSSNRIQFLERLFGRRIAEDFADTGKASIFQLLTRLDATLTDSGFSKRAIEEAIEVINSWSLNLTAHDLKLLRYVARAFIEAGPDLRFTSYYRAPRPHYPDYRTLLLETDSNGRKANYLASEEGFRTVQRLHRENRIIPIVGDLAGTITLRRIAGKLKEWDLEVNCFYLSNVEFYLFRQGRWQSYVDNMQQLPWSENAVLIRACANAWQPHPSRIPGYYMTTLLQLARNFFKNEFAGRNQTYWDMVTSNYLAP